MRSHLFLTFFFLYFFSGLPCSFSATSITRHGTTWVFDKEYESGTYLNGDPWVVGPVTIIAISPLPETGKNGSMLNPSIGREQGFDNRVSPYNSYIDELNIGKALPALLEPSSSLISSISNSTETTWGQINTFSVLTILSEPPPSGAFRPAYIGGDFSHPWKEQDVSYESLATFDKSKLSNVPILSDLEQQFSFLWYEQDLTWTGRYLHTPYQANNGYGKDMAIKTGDAALSLNLNYTNEQKSTLLYNFIQYGIDIYGIITMGGLWYDTGGHNVGRFSPLLIAAICLDDPQMKSAITGSAAKFSELRQTFYVSQNDIDNAPYYSADGRPRLPYTLDDLGKPDWGETHTDNSKRDGNNWDSFYRDICGSVLQAPAIAALVMGAREIIDHDAFFDYAQRHLYYREGFFTNPQFYNGYDDGDSYGEGNTAKLAPFKFNETPAFHRDFFLAHEHNVPSPSPPPSPPSDLLID